MRFSERMGYRPVKSAIQVDSMDDDLRVRLWNVFQPTFVQPVRAIGIVAECARDQIQIIWDELFKKPADTAPLRFQEVTDLLKPLFLDGDYRDVYDLVDFSVQRFLYSSPYLDVRYNSVLEREVSGFRFINGLLAPISNEYELDAIEDGLQVGGKFAAASTHLKTALKLLSDRSVPDYRNSMKESISAVESAAKAVTGKGKATLGDLMPFLEQSRHIHPAQKEAFSKLYGYTSDEEGIRHAMLNDALVDFADAKYMLAVCAAFIAYLHSEPERMTSVG